MSSNKKTRRNIRRLAERKGVGYGEAIEIFYGKGVSEIDKNLKYSLHKNTRGRRGQILKTSGTSGYDARNHGRDYGSHGPRQGP